MKVVYTIHAEETVKLRHLRKLQIEACVRHPDEIIPARHGKAQYIKRLWHELFESYRGGRAGLTYCYHGILVCKEAKDSIRYV